MRTGIVTFINTINYGASLQAYALQEALRSFGIDAEIIQYTNEFIRNKELNLNKKVSLKILIKTVVMGNAIKRKAEKFKAFEEKNINFGLFLNNDSVNKVNSYYDCFITGSDQVWNMDITHSDWFYFLSFVSDARKKISYAPSFGNVKFPPEKIPGAMNYLKRFDALSVREKSGQDFIRANCDLSAEVVVDPTLLLDKDEWKKITSFVPKEKHYILVYFPNNKKQVFNFVKQLSKKTGCKIIYLSISPKIERGVKTIYDASPEEFLGWFNHADYVVTGSFHGTAFSINMEKQFFYEPSGEGSRIDNIVSICGVKNRSILTPDIIDDVIDYDQVRTRLQAERQKSLDWLRGALG